MISLSESKRYFLPGEGPVVITEEFRLEVGNVSWYQSIPFSADFSSVGVVQPLERLGKYRLEEIDFSSRSVLGIGCFEGFELLWAKAHGATRVVGVADEFNHIQSFSESRRIVQKVFPGSIEWIERPVASLTEADVGQFDIVLVFDGLTHSRDPLGFLQKVSSLSRHTLVVLSPIVIGPSAVPWVATFPNFAPVGQERSVVGPNEGWIISALQGCDLHIADCKMWEYDAMSVLAVKRTPERRDEIPVPLSALPTDAGRQGETAVLVQSCERYSQAWRPFFQLFARYWPDCPYRIYLGTNSGSYNGVVTLQTGDDGSTKLWSNRLRAVLSGMTEKRVIFFQEDFLLMKRVDSSVIGKLCMHCGESNAVCIRIFPDPPPFCAWRGCSDLGVYGPFDDFRFSLQATIWDREALIAVLADGEDPWMTEFVGSRRTQFVTRPFLGTRFSAVEYFCTAIIRGEWEEGALDLLRREGISLEGITKTL